MKRISVFSLSLALASGLIVAAQSITPSIGPQGRIQAAPTDIASGAAPALPGPGFAPQPTQSVSGTLDFVDDQPVVKTAAASIPILMPRFYYYAYFDGFKAGMTMTVKGRLIQVPSANRADAAQAGQTNKALLVEELTINGKTYIVVQGEDRPMGAPNGPLPPARGAMPSRFGQVPNQSMPGEAWTGQN